MQGGAGTKLLGIPRSINQHPNSGAVYEVGYLQHLAGTAKIGSLEASAVIERLPDSDLVSKTSTLGDCPEDIALKSHGWFLSNCRTASTQSGGLASSISISSRGVEDDIPEYDSTSTSSFEFSNGERTGHRQMIGPFHKPPPSKWDDAEKWLVGVSTSEVAGRGERMKKMDTVKYTSGDGGAPHFAFKTVLVPPVKARSNDSFDCYPIGDDMKIVSMACEANGEETFLEPILRTEKPSSDSTLSENVPNHGFSTYDPPLSPHETSSYVTSLPAVRSVSMRDMGTEMTPLASQEPSRTGTPVRATTPTMRSPVSSRPSTPRRVTPAPSPMRESDAIEGGEENAKLPELTEKEMQAKTRREIFALGTQLGKANIAAWASKEEEDEDAFKSLKNIDLEEVKKHVLETRAAAWEEAEQAKYMARYMREEAKIQAWENHEKAKAEAEMRRIEVKVEKMRSHAYEKLMNKLAAARRRAEERRATAEAKRGEQAAKTAERAEYIRRTGRLPSSFFLCSLCQ